MDVKSTKSSRALADPVPLNRSRLGIRSGLLPCTHSGGPSFPASIPRKKPVKLNDVLSNGWLDAMKSSSPPRKDFIGDDFASNDVETSYLSWTSKYPSALDSFQTIVDRAKNRKLVVSLDYDGTLSPIVDDPDQAFMSDDMRSVVKNVAKNFPTAIISGRSRDKIVQVYELVGLNELYYAGSHGMDIVFPAKNRQNGIISNDDHKVFRKFIEITKEIQGSKVENHKFCVSVHYRNVDENSWPVIAQYVHDILSDYPKLRLTHGRKVLEVRPVIDWDKGKAVEFLLKSLGLSDRKDVLPIYIGDDTSDEDAFKVLRKKNLGYGILVSTVPKESNASFSLKDTSEVQDFLESLVRMAENDEKIAEAHTNKGD